MKAARVDANQQEIVAALRAAGCTVVSLATVGGGVPDLLVGRGGQNYLLEVKRPGRGRHDPEHADKQLSWHAGWRGQVALVYTREAAMRAVGLAWG